MSLKLGFFLVNYQQRPWVQKILASLNICLSFHLSFLLRLHPPLCFLRLLFHLMPTRNSSRSAVLKFLCVCVCMCSVMSDSLWPHGLQLTRVPCPWNFPDKNTRVGCHFILQGTFLTQGLDLHLPCLLHRQADSLPRCHLGSLSSFSQHQSSR